VIRAFRYQLFPTKEQETLLNKHFGCSRFVWNWGLGEKMKAYQTDKTNLTRYQLQAKLPIMKKTEEFSWLKEVNSLAIQSKLEDLDKAYVAFYRKKSDFPKFKSKKNKQSFRIPQNTKVNFDDGKIVIPKFLEGIKFDNHRKFEGEVSSSYITKTQTGKYHISILVEDNKVMPTKPQVNEKSTVGIDLGISNFATISNGTKVDNPRFLKIKLDRLRRENNKLSRKKKDSKNRDKQRIKLAKLHEQITNSRKDFQHKLSYRLTHDNQVDTIVMETLSIKQMSKNHSLARHIQDCAWYQFQTYLKYKCDWYGKNFIQIGKYEPSSKLCSCGVINHQLTLKDRNWTCKVCGVTHDRDILASINIKQIGLVQPESKPVESGYCHSSETGNPISLELGSSY
jgi:putative transposase